MSLSSVIEVALGLTLIYYVLSLVVSYITTAFGRFSELRAKNLAKQLQELLQYGDKTGNPSQIFDDFMKHPWIKSLAPKSLNWRLQETHRQIDRISRDRFAMTLLDLWIPDKNDNASLDLAAIKTKIEMLPDGERKKALLRAVNDSIKQMKDMRQLLEGWYDETMVNVSTLYKQKIRLIAIIVALVVTLLLGVDSVTIATGLWNSPMAREALADAATQIEDIDPETLTGDQAKDLLTSLPNFQAEADFSMWWTCDEINRTWLIISGRENIVLCNGQSANEQPADQPVEGQTVQAQLTDGEFVRWKGLGLLITWIAIAQGSSFWYQILRGIRKRSEVAGSSTQSVSGQPPGDASPQSIEVVVKPSPPEETEKKEESPKGEESDPSPPLEADIEKLAQLAVEVVAHLKAGNAEAAVNRKMAIGNLKIKAAKQDLNSTPRQIEDTIDAILGGSVEPTPENEEQDNDDNE